MTTISSSISCDLTHLAIESDRETGGPVTMPDERAVTNVTKSTKSLLFSMRLICDHQSLGEWPEPFNSHPAETSNASRQASIFAAPNRRFTSAKALGAVFCFARDSHISFESQI
ncbi:MULTISPECIES: hypothetical protein [unclassified Rhizobium]|uniref:hypothetical protein n=1 Tax=unclassified Rhizobium TaxID=2613769 RepID=UPI001FDF71A8|nr:MULTISPECIES: hypothetical protein [unclassified Rhizobium]